MSLSEQAQTLLHHARDRQVVLQDRALKLLSTSTDLSTGERVNSANQLWLSPQSLLQDYHTHLADLVYHDGSINDVAGFGSSYEAGLKLVDKGGMSELGLWDGTRFGSALFLVMPVVLAGDEYLARKGREQMYWITRSASSTGKCFRHPEFQSALDKLGLDTRMDSSIITSTKEQRNKLLRQFRRPTLAGTLGEDPTLQRVARIVDKITAASREVMSMDNETLYATLQAANRGQIELAKSITVPEVLTQQLLSCAMVDHLSDRIDADSELSGACERARSGAGSLLERVEQLTDAWVRNPADGEALFDLSRFFEATGKGEKEVRGALWRDESLKGVLLGDDAPSYYCLSVDELPKRVADEVNTWSRRVWPGVSTE